LVSTEVGCGPLGGGVLGGGAVGGGALGGGALGAEAGLEFGVAELLLPGEALEVAVLEPELKLLTEAEVLPENGFADPEPQPTTEATAMAAALNFTKTLGSSCTFEPRYRGIPTN
jgi:hypothetical protein